METATKDFSTDPDEIQEVLTTWKNFIGDKLITNLSAFAKKGKLSVDLSNMREIDRWDGNLRIRLINVSNEELINYIIGWAYGDEISMEDGVMCIWWD